MSHVSQIVPRFRRERNAQTREMATVRDRGPARAHWLFRSTGGEPSCLCILEYEDGRYWVFDSPTGTYASGHADRGKWRLEEERYLARGYVREAEAKASGLIPSNWYGAPPDPEVLWQRKLRMRRALAILIVTLVVVLAWAFISGDSASP